MARIVEAKMRHARLFTCAIERKAQRVCRDRKHPVTFGPTLLCARDGSPCLQQFDGAGGKSDRMVKDDVGITAVLDAPQDRSASFQVDVAPCQTQKATAPGTGFKSKLDQRAQPSAAGLIAGFEKPDNLLRR